MSAKVEDGVLEIDKSPSAQELVRRMRAFRGCYFGYLVQVAGASAPPAALVESAFLACATEERALASQLRNRGQTPDRVEEGIATYRGALKQDAMVRFQGLR